MVRIYQFVRETELRWRQTFDSLLHRSARIPNDEESRFILVPSSYFQSRLINHNHFNTPGVLSDDTPEERDVLSPLPYYQIMAITREISRTGSNDPNLITNADIANYYRTSEELMYRAWKNSIREPTEARRSAFRSALDQYETRVRNIKRLATFLRRPQSVYAQNLLNVCEQILGQIRRVRRYEYPRVPQGELYYNFLTPEHREIFCTAIDRINIAPLNSCLRTLDAFSALQHAARGVGISLEGQINISILSESARIYGLELDRYCRSVETLFRSMNWPVDINRIRSRFTISGLLERFIRRNAETKPPVTLTRILDNGFQRYPNGLRQIEEIAQLVDSIKNSSRRAGGAVPFYGMLVVPEFLPDAINSTYHAVTGDNLSEETQEATGSSISAGFFLGMVWTYAQNGFSVPKAIAVTVGRTALAAVGINVMSDPLETGLEWLGIEISEDGFDRRLFNVNRAALYFIAEHLARQGIRRLSVIGLRGLISSGIRLLTVELTTIGAAEAMPLILGFIGVSIGYLAATMAVGATGLGLFTHELETNPTFRNRVAFLLDEGSDGDITMEDFGDALLYIRDEAEALESELRLAEMDISQKTVHGT